MDAPVGLAHGHEPGVRAAEAQGHAEALRGADHHVGAPLAGRGEQGQASRSVATQTTAPVLVRRGDDRGEVADSRRSCRGVRAARRTARRAARSTGGSPTTSFEAERLGPGLDDLDHLRMAVGVDEERVADDLGLPTGSSVIASAAAVASSSSEALARSMPVRSVTMVWKFSSASSRPWEISGWYGRVGGVPGGVLEHVAGDHRRRERAVVPGADQRRDDLVLRRDRRRSAVERRRARSPTRVRPERLGDADGLGHGGGHQVLDRVVADRGRASSAIVVAVGSEVAVGEGLDRERELPVGVGSVGGGTSGELRAGRWTVGRPPLSPYLRASRRRCRCFPRR